MRSANIKNGMQLNNELNELLTETFNVILKGEERALQKMGDVYLSISEFHIIEIIAKNDRAKNTVSSLASALGLSMPSVTVAIKKLENKGLVEKIKSSEDGRSAFIAITEKGAQLNDCHERFHAHMIAQITEQLGEEEKELLFRVILKLNKYFKKLWEKEVSNI